MAQAVSFFIFLWASASAQSPVSHQKLMLVGGGHRPPLAMQKWVNWTAEFTAEHSDRTGKILVMTWAAEIPEQAFVSLKTDLQAAGAREIIASLRGPAKGPTYEAEKRLLLAQISEASGIFFSGGNQAEILKVLQDPDLMAALKNAYWEMGLPMAGTSAGTAVMSEKMILGDALGITDGLGFLPRTVVDQHFLKRNRVERLRAGLRQAPTGFSGVGVDEDGAILWENSSNRLEFKGVVVGEKQVMILRPIPGSDRGKGVRYFETLLQPNQTANLNCSGLLKRP